VTAINGMAVLLLLKPARPRESGDPVSYRKL
jgi:hypothetical protein